MRRRPLLISFLLSTMVSFAVAQSGPQNLEFEEGVAGSVPTGWVVSTKGYSASLTSGQPKAGKFCAELARNAQTDPAPFGNLMQSFDATPFRGKRVRFRAAVRTELSNESDRAQLWLRVDRRNEQMGFFDNMMNRPIRTREWTYYEIAGAVEPDATRINLGVMLLVSGKLWIDDASFEVLGEAFDSTLEAVRPLSARGLQNLTAFARLYGYVRFFHPSDEAANTDWDAFAINGVRQIESAANDEELVRRLSLLFHPIAPAVTIQRTATPYKLPADLLITMEAPDRKITYWQHYGVGLKANDTGSVYNSRRMQRAATASDDTPLPHVPWRAELGGVTVWVPLALYVDAKGTLPHTTAAEKTSGGPVLKYWADDRGTRLADVIIAWNVFQHFYPYFDVVQTDWPAALSAGLKAAATDPDAAAFSRTLRRLVRELHDGHGGVYGTGTSMLRSLPLQWDWVENQLVVTAVGPSAKESIAPGDAVLSINGQPATEALAAAEALISGATPQWVRYRALQDLLSPSPGAQSAKLVIEPFRDPGKTVTVTVAFEPGMQARAEEPRPAKLAELAPGIFYVDPARMTNDDFNAALPQLAKARGIIFEFRGYPRIGPGFLTHLSDKNLASAQWHVPSVVWPDRHHLKFQRGGEWDLSPAAPLFTAKLAFITDGRAISYAESCMGIVEHYRLGEIVGAPTAGTNGNVNPFSLPGGYNVTWTGMKVLKHDGSRHHGIGILPTVPVARTRAGIASGRDEFLEAAQAAVMK